MFCITFAKTRAEAYERSWHQQHRPMTISHDSQPAVPCPSESPWLQNQEGTVNDGYLSQPITVSRVHTPLAICVCGRSEAMFMTEACRDWEAKWVSEVEQLVNGALQRAVGAHDSAVHLPLGSEILICPYLLQTQCKMEEAMDGSRIILHSPLQALYFSLYKIWATLRIVWKWHVKMLNCTQHPEYLSQGSTVALNYNFWIHTKT